MKLLSNKEYRSIIGETEALTNDYEQAITSLSLDNKDYELKIDTIRNKLYELYDSKKQSKDKIFQKIGTIIKYIEKGK